MGSKLHAGVAVLLLILLFIKQTVEAPAKPCDQQDGVQFRLSLRSHRNSTGYRIVNALLESEGPDGQDVAVNISQKSARVGNKELITLDTVAAVIPETLEHAERLESSESRPVTEAALDEDFEEVRYVDYEHFEGIGYYKLHVKAATWSDARTKCHEEHAHLLVVDTQAEADVAKKILARKTAFSDAKRNDLLFVGFSDAEQEGHYVTETGKNLTSLAYQTWHKEEPTKGKHQNGGGIDLYGNLHDIPNDWKLAFVCEANKIPN